MQVTSRRDIIDQLLSVYSDYHIEKFHNKSGLYSLVLCLNIIVIAFIM